MLLAPSAQSRRSVRTALKISATEASPISTSSSRKHKHPEKTDGETKDETLELVSRKRT